MAVISPARGTALHTSRCRLAWRGDFAELHARTGLLTLDLDDRTLLLAPGPIPIHPIACSCASLLARGFALAPACGAGQVTTGAGEPLLELVQSADTVSLYPDIAPDLTITVCGTVLRSALVAFLREFRG